MRSWFRWTVWGFCSFAVGFGAQLQWANSSQWMWWSLAVERRSSAWWSDYGTRRWCRGGGHLPR